MTPYPHHSKAKTVWGASSSNSRSIWGYSLRQEVSLAQADSPRSGENSRSGNSGSLRGLA